MQEKQIELKLRDAVKSKGGLALKFVSPGTAGVPDRIVLIPDGRLYFVELKAPGKRLSPKQVKMAAVLERLGHKVRVIDSTRQVKEFMDELYPA
ncbi:MAG: nuclease [Desulfosporosinus sp. BRH_c37]|nr:MAG: nuclease [Desulfosporosinus sp. BRH_c37]